MISFTNHALDHILSSVLDANITEKLVRLGNRTADEKIAAYSLSNLESKVARSRNSIVGREYRALKNAEEALKALTTEVFSTSAPSEQILRHLEIDCPEKFNCFSSPPEWISIFKALEQEGENGGKWQKVGSKMRNELLDDSMYTFWREGRDLDRIQESQQSAPTPSPPTQPLTTNRFAALEVVSDNYHDASSADHSGSEDEDNESVDEPLRVEEGWRNSDVWAGVAEPARPSVTPPTSSDSSSVNSVPGSPAETDIQNLEEFFFRHGCDEVPTVPSSKRPLCDLLEAGDVWRMSYHERKILHAHWNAEVREALSAAHLQKYESLREAHADALHNFKESKDEVGAVNAQLLDEGLPYAD